MSPPEKLSTEVEFVWPAVNRDVSVERFVELHVGSGEAEALRVGRDLETAALPLHDVVVADGALVQEAADAT
jgi:hypothetical protein